MKNVSGAFEKACWLLKRSKQICCMLLPAIFLQSTLLFAQTQVQTRATIQVDLAKEIGAMKPVWAWFGHDEPNYTYMKDGKKLLTELSALSPIPVYMRVHKLHLARQKG